jgi:hypothetical protein
MDRVFSLSGVQTQALLDSPENDGGLRVLMRVLSRSSLSVKTV